MRRVLGARLAPRVLRVRRVLRAPQALLVRPAKLARLVRPVLLVPLVLLAPPVLRVRLVRRVLLVPKDRRVRRALPVVEASRSATSRVAASPPDHGPRPR